MSVFKNNSKKLDSWNNNLKNTSLLSGQNKNVKLDIDKLQKDDV